MPKSQYWYWNDLKETLEYFDSFLNFENKNSEYTYVGCFSDRVWAIRQIANITKHGGYNKTLTKTLNEYFTEKYPELLL